MMTIQDVKHTRAHRKANCSDLMIAYLIIAIFGVIAYIGFYLILTYSSKNALQVQIEMGDIIIQQQLHNAKLQRMYLDHLPVETYLDGKERQKECNECFHDVHVIGPGGNICKPSRFREVQLLILIVSDPVNLQRRLTLRKTWLSPYINNTENVRYLFLLGLSELVKYDEIVESENNTYKDILQGDFIEDYHNLTYKTVMGLKWAVTHCNAAQMILKVDDDVWLNMDSILKTARYSTNHSFAVGGKCMIGMEPKRKPYSKWYASYDSFPKPHYPPFCLGPGYFITMKAVEKIVEISKNIPYFHLEDVYIGMCVKKLGLTVKNLKGFFTKKPKGHPCRFKLKSVRLVHQILQEDMQKLWGSFCGKGLRNHNKYT